MSQKLITFAVPCYNSAAYMRHCIETLLSAGEQAEIILVDDVSVKDDTPAICDEYASRYPTIVKAIHQENGGHGEGINQGLKHATGTVHLLNSTAYLSEKHLAFCSESNTFSRTEEQLALQFLFQILDIFCDRRLCQTQMLCRQGNIFRVSHLIKYFIIIKADVHSVYPVFCVKILLRYSYNLW